MTTEDTENTERATPETDAKASPHIGFYSCATVPANFARALERERDEARQQYDDLATEHVLAINKLAEERDQALMDRANGDMATMTINHYERILRERDEARVHWGTESMNAAQFFGEKTKAIAERDEAREALREAWLAMDEIDGTDRINNWQNKYANILEDAK